MPQASDFHTRKQLETSIGRQLAQTREKLRQQWVDMKLEATSRETVCLKKTAALSDSQKLVFQERRRLQHLRTKLVIFDQHRRELRWLMNLLEEHEQLMRQHQRSDQQKTSYVLSTDGFIKTRGYSEH